jgi:AraC-like DNA-binding protein
MNLAPEPGDGPAWTRHLRELISALEHEQAAQQTKVDHALEWARSLIDRMGGIRRVPGEEIRLKAVHQITLHTHPVELPAWYLDDELLYRNRGLVDQIQRQTQCTATVFQRIEAGYLRIATNVPRGNGAPAVGTYIPHASPVAQTITAAQVYRGRALVLDQWYTTAYAPIRLDGEIRGMLYVGLPEVDQRSLSSEAAADDAALFDALSQFYQQHQEAVHDMVQHMTGLFAQHEALRERYPLIELGLRAFITLLLQVRTHHLLGEEEGKDPTDRLLAYIQANLAQAISVETLADLLCMSQPSLYRYFKENLGRSPGEFILEERLRRAAELLTEGDLSVKEVGYEVGFSSPSYFIKRFRQQYGCTPREYQA